MSTGNSADDSEEEQANYDLATIESAEETIDRGKENTDRTEKVLPDEFGDDVELIEEQFDDVAGFVDDLQDGNPEALAAATAAIRTIDGRIERLQAEVGYGDPDAAEAIEALDDDQDDIEDAIEALVDLGDVHSVYVNDHFVKAYADDTVQTATILAHAGKTPVADYTIEALDDAKADGGDPVAEFGHEEPIDLGDEHRTYFESHTDGGGKA